MDDSGEGGFARDETTPDKGEPAAACILDFLDPRNAIRAATVWQMKDRAGTVGALGVGPLLQEILTQSSARIHLMGHSYGGKVVLSALCHSQLKRDVTSVLLLQPAVSYLCFGENIDGKGTDGGYREALTRVERPIFSTFSGRDAPLTKFFHLAVRRDSDLGEQKIAGVPPSKFAALGGSGPGGPGRARAKR
jgi:pimeloyl-ACP methyl ester carboxylesterase